MSSTRRVLSGNLANLMRIAATLFVQVALVPIYLHKWSGVKYGIWQAAIAYIAVLSIFDYGFQNYLEGEFLRLGTDRHDDVRRKLWSTFPIGIIQGTIEFILTAIIVATGHLAFALGARTDVDIRSANELGIAILPLVFLSSTFSSGVGIFNRVVSPYGHYSKLAWWGVISVLVQSLVPSMVAYRGGDMGQAAWAYGIAMLILNLAQLVVYYKIFKKHDLMPRRADWGEGIRDWVGSLVLTVKATADLLRNQGSTLVLIPLVGAAGMASFRTMRTVANALLQGLGTVTGPILPELMRFVNRRDQGKVEAAFSVVWLTILGVFMPCSLLLQLIAPKFYPIWTHHKLAFDPLFFAIVSMSVLVYGMGQPAFAIIRGNNITKTQFNSAVAAGVITVGGIFILVPGLDVRNTTMTLLGLILAVVFAAVRQVQRRIGAKSYAHPWPSFAAVVAVMSLAGWGIAEIMKSRSPVEFAQAAGGILNAGGMFVFVPGFGLKGAAMALLLAEVVSTAMLVHAARKWMGANDLIWPKRSFAWVAAGILSTAGIFAVVVLWKGHAIIAGLAGLGVQAVTACGYWASLPGAVRSHAYNVLHRKRGAPAT